MKNIYKIVFLILFGLTTLGLMGLNKESSLALNRLLGLLELGCGKGEKGDFNARNGVFQCRSTGEQRGTGCDHIIHDENVFASEFHAIAFAGTIHSLGALQAFGSVFVGLCRVFVKGFQRLYHRQPGGISDALCQILALVEAAAGKLGVVQRHGYDKIYAVKEMAAFHVTCCALGEPATQGGHVAVLHVVEYRGVGVAFLVEEIAGAAFHRHFPCHKLLKWVEVDVLVSGARDVHQALAADEFLVESERLVAHRAGAGHEHTSGTCYEVFNLHRSGLIFVPRQGI